MLEAFFDFPIKCNELRKLRFENICDFPKIIFKLKFMLCVLCLACRQKVTLSFLQRPDLPSLAYKKLKGKSPGIIFIPGYLSDMNGIKALAIEEFCKSLGHGYIR